VSACCRYSPIATGDAFRGGGERAHHPDGYGKIKHRSKDIIISGGENISSIDIDGVLYKNPEILAAAIAAKLNPK
jgi:fatty-acyl-CoA synthase